MLFRSKPGTGLGGLGFGLAMLGLIPILGITAGRFWPWLVVTVITLIPISVVFAFLQKYITTGIASAGVK